MILTSLIVNISGILFIGFILWWFFGNKPQAKQMSGTAPITILVKDGVYEPSHISVPVGKVVTLRFIRKDHTSCASSVLFPQLDLAYDLPFDQAIDIIIPPQEAGQFDFHCEMAMYKGKLIVG